MISELEAIDRVLSGDKDAYRSLVERHHKGLCIYLFHMVHDQMQAEDLAQEAFIRAYEHLETYDRKYAFSTWLYRIARNLALRQLEVKSKEPKNFRLDSSIDFADETYARHQNESEMEVLKRSIGSLKPEYQEVINLYYWNDKSYAEIAQILSCPVNTVRTWLLRSKELLRKEIYGQV